MTRSSWLAIVVALVAVSACEQRDPLYCPGHMEDPRCSFEGDGGVPEGFVVIGGNVNGLTGSGLVLVLNGGQDNKQISSSGAFSFGDLVPQGTVYDVTVGTQPTNPSEMCTVANGMGTANVDVTDIEVTCTPAAYTVGGTVAGFTPGGSIVLINGTEMKTITTGGAFTFTMPVKSGDAYDVQLGTQMGENCTVIGGSGVVGSAPVTTVVVNCSTNAFIVGGQPAQGGGVTGLNGRVVLHNNNDTITVTANGAFAFPTPITGGGTNTYNVTVMTQPAYPPVAQNCVVTNGSGTVGTANITNVKVTCMTKTFTIGGNVSGLTGTVVLRNGGDMKSVTANGAFTMNTPVLSGQTYAVSVGSQPSGQQCTVTMGSGTVTNNNVTSVVVTCVNVGVKCGNAGYCNNGNVCCDPEGNESCRSSQQCNSFELPCDDRADCGSGKYCCAQRHNGNGDLELVRCESSCNNLNNPKQLCDPTKNECVNGSCQPWSQLPGYYACQ